MTNKKPSTAAAVARGEAMELIPDFLVQKLVVNAVRASRLIGKTPQVTQALMAQVSQHCCSYVTSEVAEFIGRESNVSCDEMNPPVWFGKSVGLPIGNEVIAPLAHYTGLLARLENDDGKPPMQAVIDVVLPILTDAVGWGCPQLVEALFDKAVCWSGFERAVTDLVMDAAVSAITTEPNSTLRWNVFHALLVHSSNKRMRDLGIDATKELANVIKCYSTPAAGCRMVKRRANVLEALREVHAWTRDCVYPMRMSDHVAWLATKGNDLLKSMQHNGKLADKGSVTQLLKDHDYFGLVKI